mgnify:FL=1
MLKDWLWHARSLASTSVMRSMDFSASWDDLWRWNLVLTLNIAVSSNSFDACILSLADTGTYFMCNWSQSASLSRHSSWHHSFLLLQLFNLPEFIFSLFRCSFELPYRSWNFILLIKTLIWIFFTWFQKFRFIWLMLLRIYVLFLFNFSRLEVHFVFFVLIILRTVPIIFVFKTLSFHISFLSIYQINKQ